MINCSSVKDSAESAELLQSTKLLAESALAQLQLAHNRIKEAL